MYGYKDVYFNRNREGFRNSVWIELLGFDHTSPDFGVEKFLSATGFVPHMVSFLLTSVRPYGHGARGFLAPIRLLLRGT